MKPFTSRAVNDERYVVCQGFKKNKKLDLHLEKKRLVKICEIKDEWFVEVQNIASFFANSQTIYLNKALNANINRGKGKGRGRGMGRGRGRGRFQPY